MPTGQAPAAATPGQKLLKSLHETSAGRLQRCLNTTAAKAAKAKHSIPKPKPPSNNDIGNAPVEEVHQLPADVPKAHGNMQGILAMLQDKADRHAATWARYQTAKQAAENFHNTTAAAVAADSRDVLEAINNSIEADMAVLAEDRVMVLDEQQLQQVWQCVERQRDDITAGIEALGAGLQSAEEALKQGVQAALQQMVADMSDIAHLDEGRLQRLTEQEATALNLQLLDNRATTAEVLQQLQAKEVLQEQARFKRWQAACQSWRTLRSRHAVQCFCQHIKQDLAEPPERLQLFVQLREGQQEAHSQLVKLCRRLQQLLPPHLTPQSVSTWTSQAKHWSSTWQQQLDQHLLELQQQEKQIEDKTQQDYAALRTEVLGYQSLPDIQVDELLEQEVQPVLISRQQAAQQLLKCAEAFLQRQASEWQLALQVLGTCLSSLVSLVESQKTSSTAAEADIKAAVRAAVQRFQTEDAAREAVLTACVELLNQSSDERELDTRLEAALQALAAIQGGYRDHTAAAVGAVRAYPGQVKNRIGLYMKCLCGLLHVQPQQPASKGSPVGAWHSAATSVAGSVAPGASKDVQAAAAKEPGGVARDDIQLPAGAAYQRQHDLWQALLDATPKPWLQQFQQLQSHQQDRTDAQPPAAVQTAAADAAAPPPPKPAPAGKMTKQQLAEAAAAEEAVQAAAEAAAAAAAAEAAAFEAAAAQPPCPTSADDAMLCLDLLTPHEFIVEGLQELQVSVLQEAESFTGRCQGGAESWAEQMEALLTEELDGRLRAHRPRAGRLEEEVRAARSTELVAQRRRVDAHLKAQEKAGQQQAAQVESAVLALRADAADWRAKLLDYERLLGNALSTKGIDICWREAQALRAKLDKQLEQRVQQLQQLIDATCSSLAAASTSFEAQHLRSFADGGQYAEASLAAHRVNLAALHAYVSQQQQLQQAQRSALHTELTSSLQEAQDKIQQLLPSFLKDMALVELLAQQVEGAKRKVAAALSNNTQAAEAIDQVLEQLKDCLKKATVTGQGQDEARAVAASADCQRLLTCVDSLRQQLLRQSQVIELLRSTGIPDRAVAVVVPSDLQPLPAPGAPESVGTCSTLPPPLPTSRATTPQTTKGSAQAGGKSAAKGSGPRAGSAAGNKAAQAAAAAAAAAALAAMGGVGAPAAASEAPAVPLAKCVSSIIDGIKQEVEAAAKTYYSVKEPGRPIRYPSKIAPSLQELMAVVDSTMSDMGQMLQAHITHVTKRLRVQVVQAYRLLEKVPAAAMSLMVQHLLGVSAEQRDQLLRGFITQRHQLEQQLEQHKRKLHPSMMHVARCAELEALKASEASRQQAAAVLTSCCAAACTSLTQHHAQQLAATAADLSRLLLLLLDGCVMPADLVPAPEGDDALAGVQRLSLEELQRLAAAQDAAPPAGAALSHGQPSKAASTGKGSKPGSGAGDAAASAPPPGAPAGTTGTVAASGRPFACVSWQLDDRHRDDALSLNNLGWTDADQRAFVTEATPAAQAPPGAPPQPLTALAAGAPAKQSAGNAIPVKGPAAAHNVAASNAAASCQAPAHSEPVLVSGMDTVCHTAVVLAHRAAIQQVQTNLAQASVAGLKQLLYAWTNHEQQWMRSWEAMLQDMDNV